MNAITANRDILIGEDFTGDFEEALCAYLNNLIDEELAKGDETDFDLIDEYAEAINCIRENGAEILPVISKRDFMKKLGITHGSPAVKIAAVAAAAAVILGIGAAAARETPTEIARDTAKYFRELFGLHNLEPVTEHTTQSTTAAPKASKAEQVKINGIELKFNDNFRREYYVGESFDKTGLEVVAVTDDGTYKTDEYIIKFDSPFAEKAGEHTVTVTAYGFSESFKVRILNSEKTPVLNSIYATFPDGFDFTYKDEPDLSGMKVYAVYSNGKEKQLQPDEYTLTITETGLLFKKRADVKVEYKGCSCEFVLEEVKH